MTRKREAASEGKTAAPKRKRAEHKPAAGRQRPKRSPRLREEAAQNLARAEELDGLFRPLREAGEAELAKTASGRRVLKQARALGDELSELYQDIGSGKTPFEEGHRRARERRDEFAEKHAEQFLEAHARAARLQPSVEAVAQILHPGTASETVWVTETAFLQSMLLKPKPEPEDVATVERGLGLPPPVHSCLRPPYARKAEYGWGDVHEDAETDGHCTITAFTVTAFGVPVASSATAWLGGEFTVPAGLSHYELTVDYDWACDESGWAMFGVAVAGGGVDIQIDKDDGTPPIEVKDLSFGDRIAIVAGGLYDADFEDDGHKKTTVPFTRNVGDGGTVRVWVGVGGHGEVWAFVAGATFWNRLFVREICLKSVVGGDYAPTPMD
jgi:hypothetical protein